MVLKRNILSALFFLFYILSVHSLDYEDYDSWFEPFDVSCIKFSNENIIVVTHNIRCNETTVENEYILLNKFHFPCEITFFFIFFIYEVCCKGISLFTF